MYDERESDGDNATNTTGESVLTSATQKTPEAKKPRPRRKKIPATPGKSLLVIRRGAKELLTISFLQDDSNGLSFEFKNSEGERYERGQ